MPWDANEGDLTTKLMIMAGEKYNLHLEKGEVGVDDKWNTLYETFFEDYPEMKDRHYIQGGFRKFRDKFWNTFKKVTDFIDDKSSNKSKFEGVQPKYFEVVQKLKKEIDEKEGKKILKKQSAAQKKQRLDTNADAGVNVEPGGSEEAEPKRKPGAWSGESWKSKP